jgi:Transmembrane amino acid transporter protein
MLSHQQPRFPYRVVLISLSLSLCLSLSPSPSVYIQYGTWVAICFTINFVVGVGVLEVPYAYNRAGIAFSLAMTVVSACFILTAITWVLETSVRAMGWAAIVFHRDIETSGVTASIDDVDDSKEAVNGAKKKPLHTSFVHKMHKYMRKSPQDTRRLIASYNLDKRNIVRNSKRRFRHGPPRISAMQPICEHDEFNGEHDYEQQQHGADASANGQAYTKLSNSHSVDDVPALSPFGSTAPDGEQLQHVAFDFGNPDVIKAFKRTGNKLFELNELLDIFAPLWAKLAYEFALFVLLMMVLWTYTTVFANSMMSKFAIFDWGHDCIQDYTEDCAWTFRLYVLIYAVCVITLTCLEFVEMVAFQVAMSFARFLLIAMIVLSCFVGIFADPYDNNIGPGHSAPYTNSYGWWSWSGIVTILSATVFSQLVDFGAPTILSPLKDKRKSHRAMIGAVALACSLYAVLGVVASMYFGDQLEAQVNLNFANYTGGEGKARWWAYILQYYVTLFPALDVTSVFPLLAISLGNTLRAFLIRSSQTVRDWDRKTKKLALICRLAAAIPPILLALVERNLASIVKYSSIPSLWIAFIAPACLQYFSVRTCLRHKVQPATSFSIPFLSGRTGLVMVIVFTVLCYVFMVGELVNPEFPQ